MIKNIDVLKQDVLVKNVAPTTSFSNVIYDESIAFH